VYQAIIKLTERRKEMKTKILLVPVGKMTRYQRPFSFGKNVRGKIPKKIKDFAA